jgi:hypothetical protein
MPRYFHWHRDPFRPEPFRHFDDHWRERHDEPHHDPGFHLPFPLPPLPLPFGLEVEGGYPPGEEEAERQHYHRSRWARSQGDPGQGEFGGRGEEFDSRRHRGRWVRDRGRVVLLGL